MSSALGVRDVLIIHQTSYFRKGRELDLVASTPSRCAHPAPGLSCQLASLPKPTVPSFLWGAIHTHPSKQQEFTLAGHPTGSRGVRISWEHRCQGKAPQVMRTPLPTWKKLTLSVENHASHQLNCKAFGLRNSKGNGP